MRRQTTSLIVFLILAIPLASAWSWDSYEGKTTWDVKVTVDESGECGGTAHSYYTPLTITHKKSVAELTDLGHGATTGKFFSNILTVPGRTIPDGSGTSALGSASVAFSPDCKTFYTKYTWRYHDQYQDCSGTTAWEGKRTDSTACPDAFYVAEKLPLPQVMKTAAEVRALPKAEQKEEYEKILKEKPKDPEANYGLAQINREEKDYAGFVKGIDTALEDKAYADKLTKARQKEVKERLGFTIDPTKVIVPLIAKEKKDLDSIAPVMIYDFNVLKAPPDTRSWYERMREYLSKPFYDVVRN